MAGRNVEMTISTDHTYVPYASINYITGELEAYTQDLEFRLQALQDLSNYVTDFKEIAKKLEQTAKEFVYDNGTVKTGNLVNSIRAEISGNTINLGVPGVPYAGHIEWGFTGRDGMPHGPWPYIRPAMQLVSANSTNRLGQRMESLIANGRLGTSGSLQFGRHDPFTYTLDRHDMSNAYKTDKSIANNNTGWVKAANGIRGQNWSGQTARFNKHGEL